MRDSPKGGETAKSGQFTADKTGKGQFIRGNCGNPASRKRVAGVPNLLQCLRGQWVRNMSKGVLLFDGVLGRN